jgi:hypothetical protein
MSVDIGQVIKLYVATKEKISILQGSIKEQLAEYEKQLDVIEIFLKKQLNEQQLTSFKSDYGTVSLKNTPYANVQNFDEFWQFVRDNDLQHFVHKKVIMTSVKDYIEENQKVPPGIEYGSLVKLSYTSPSAKSRALKNISEPSDE